MYFPPNYIYREQLFHFIWLCNTGYKYFTYAFRLSGLKWTLMYVQVQKAQALVNELMVEIKKFTVPLTKELEAIREAYRDQVVQDYDKARTSLKQLYPDVVFPTFKGDSHSRDFPMYRPEEDLVRFKLGEYQRITNEFAERLNSMLCKMEEKLATNNLTKAIKNEVEHLLDNVTIPAVPKPEDLHPPKTATKTKAPAAKKKTKTKRPDRTAILITKVKPPLPSIPTGAEDK